MNELIIDSSVVVKWLVPELGTPAALALRGRYRFVAPELLILECANVFWKKARRGELTAHEALMFAQAVERTDIEFVSMRSHAETVMKLAMEIDHPVYDCTYLALALERSCQFATADGRFVKALQRRKRREVNGVVVLLDDLVQ